MEAEPERKTSGRWLRTGLEWMFAALLGALVEGPIRDGFYVLTRGVGIGRPPAIEISKVFKQDHQETVSTDKGGSEVVLIQQTVFALTAERLELERLRVDITAQESASGYKLAIQSSFQSEKDHCKLKAPDDTTKEIDGKERIFAVECEPFPKGATLFLIFSKTAGSDRARVDPEAKVEFDASGDFVGLGEKRPVANNNFKATL